MNELILPRTAHWPGRPRDQMKQLWFVFPHLRATRVYIGWFTRCTPPVDDVKWSSELFANDFRGASCAMDNDGQPKPNRTARERYLIIGTTSKSFSHAILSRKIIFYEIRKANHGAPFVYQFQIESKQNFVCPFVVVLGQPFVCRGSALASKHVFYLQRPHI